MAPRPARLVQHLIPCQFDTLQLGMPALAGGVPQSCKQAVAFRAFVLRHRGARRTELKYEVDSLTFRALIH
jgi:hypothetical protein